ncbi:MAG: hypothetical protein IBJ09_04745 [Bacteroidia bacterium]|nr:hypothetical protein [Bacteroidia bacterium]
MFSFLNYHKDPNDRSRWVFYYKDRETGDFFAQICKEKGLEYKKLSDPEKPDIQYYSFSKASFDEAQRLNAEAMSRTPRSFIPDKGLRIFTLVLFGVMVAIALTGYIVTRLKK